MDFHSRMQRMVKKIEAQGLTVYAESFALKYLNKMYVFEKNHAQIEVGSWRKINFKALGLYGSAQLLLNPQDAGFSKEFSVYGFREPLNTYAIFNYVAKNKPAVLDIGGNVGYFPLVELAAGAKQVIVVEPVASTYSYLSKTLKRYKQVQLFNLAISDRSGLLTLYVAEQRNVTSSSKQIITNSGRAVLEEITSKADTIESMAEKYPFNMIRMDVEGHEYRILNGKIPDQVTAINIELHVIPPYSKALATKLLEKLYSQNFKATVAIKEMSYGYYPLIKGLGLKTTYKLATTILSKIPSCPNVQTNLSLKELINQVPKKAVIHLLLER
jgi:FkbM family methyltransferase